MTTLEIENKKTELQAQIQQLAQDAIKQAEAERAERLDQIAACEEQAQTYRNQATKALTDEDKQRLYQYAEDSENQAIELRKELGLITPEQIQDAGDDKRRKLRYRIIELVTVSIVLYIGYLIGDYNSAIIKQGFFSYALKSVSSLCYAVSIVLSGLLLAYSVLAPFIGNYILKELRTDFTKAGPMVRLLVLLGLFFSILLTLSTLAKNVH